MSTAPQGPDRGPAPTDRDEPEYAGFPKWVKLLLAALVVLILVLLVATWLGGDHGPGRHLSRGALGVTQAHAPVDVGLR